MDSHRAKLRKARRERMEAARLTAQEKAAGKRRRHRKGKGVFCRREHIPGQKSSTLRAAVQCRWPGWIMAANELRQRGEDTSLL